MLLKRCVDIENEGRAALRTGHIGLELEGKLSKEMYLRLVG